MAVYVNFEEGVKRVMNNAAFYLKMLGKFLADPSLNELEAALAEGDLEKAYSSVHTLKGLAGNLSLIELANQSLELENQIKAKDINPGQLDILKAAHAQTLTEVQKVLDQHGK